MSYDESVSEHYVHGGLLEVIEAVLSVLGKTIGNVTIEDLAPVEIIGTYVNHEQLKVGR